MGGSSKPADPKVTPFQEPAAPANPVPNWFTGTGGGATGAGSFTPDFGASKGAFGAHAPAAQATPAPIASAAPAAPQAQPMPFAIPTPQVQQQAPMQPGVPSGGGFNMGAGEQFSHFLPQQVRDIMGRLMGMQGAPRMGMGMGGPRYTNYTDTNPAFSTGADGGFAELVGGGNGMTDIGNVFDMFSRSPRKPVAPRPQEHARQPGVYSPEDMALGANMFQRGG